MKKKIRKALWISIAMMLAGLAGSAWAFNSGKEVLSLVLLVPVIAGAVIRVRFVRCPHCDFPLRGLEDYCSKCGHRID